MSHLKGQACSKAKLIVFRIPAKKMHFFHTFCTTLEDSLTLSPWLLEFCLGLSPKQVDHEQIIKYAYIKI